MDVDRPHAARGNDEQAADEAMMPPCHTGEEAYGKKDDVLSYGTGFIYSLPQLLAEHWASHSIVAKAGRSVWSR
jgi:hypothetical protein